MASLSESDGYSNKQPDGLYIACRAPAFAAVSDLEGD
jgi:hypothetical protein